MSKSSQASPVAPKVLQPGPMVPSPAARSGRKVALTPFHDAWEKEWHFDAAQWIAFHCSGMAFALVEDQGGPNRPPFTQADDDHLVRANLLGGLDAGRKWAETHWRQHGAKSAHALLREIALRACEIRTWAESKCGDCGDFAVGEYYMVRDALWDSVAKDGLLCVACLEKRLGRQLVPGDFTECEVNTEKSLRSVRLLSRLLGLEEWRTAAEWGFPEAPTPRMRGYTRTMKAYFAAVKRAERAGKAPPLRPEYIAPAAPRRGSR